MSDLPHLVTRWAVRADGQEWVVDTYTQALNYGRALARSVSGPWLVVPVHFKPEGGRLVRFG
jgi:hypothetical protein